MKTIFEQTGGSYTIQGDYLLPYLKLPEKKQREIGVWGQRHRCYLKQYHKVRYYNLLTSGKLNEYLSDVNERAEDMFLRLEKELSEKDGVTEKLKAENQILWLQKSNNIRSITTEIICKELIYT